MLEEKPVIEEGQKKTPGDAIRELLAEKGWSQIELASILGRTPAHVSEVIQGKRGVTPEFALELAAAFWNDPQYWMGLEANRQLASADAQTDDVRRRARLYDVAPVKEMERRGWIRETKDTDELDAELKRFFGVDNLDDDPQIGAVTRKSDTEEPLSAAQRAWCFRVRQLASSLVIPPFRHNAIASCKKELRVLAAYPQESHKISKVLTKYGIRYVVVEPLSGIKVDGVALWLDADSPVIGMSLRYDRVDSFWFTLSHELIHIENRDEAPLDADLTDRMEGISVVRSEMERRANDGAADMLIASNELRSFIQRVGPLYSKDKIVRFAHRVKIHPGIVVGQLQRRDEIGYHANREMLSKIRHFVASASLTDGWGHTID